MRYASTKAYAGQRAYITAPVVIHTEDSGFAAGTIVRIETDTDTEEIWICEAGEDGFDGDLVFHPTQTEEEVDAMPAGCWTWPVRV